MINPLKKWKRGDYCIAKFTDKKFYRARIIETPEGKISINPSLFRYVSSIVTETNGLYDVVFVDYGNWDRVALTDIRTLLPKFATLTAQAIPCSLTEVSRLNKLAMIDCLNDRRYLEVILGLIIQRP